VGARVRPKMLNMPKSATNLRAQKTSSVMSHLLALPPACISDRVEFIEETRQTIC